jgi:hypothetical protein
VRACVCACVRVCVCQNDDPPMRAAISAGHVDVVKYFVDYGVDIISMMEVSAKTFTWNATAQADAHLFYLFFLSFFAHFI